MTDNKLIRFSFFWMALFWVCPVAAQNTPEKETSAAEKDTASSDEAETPQKDAAEKDDASRSTDGDAEAGAPSDKNDTNDDDKAEPGVEDAEDEDVADDDVEGEVADDELEEEDDEETLDDDEASEGDEDDTSEVDPDSAATLSSPKTVDLDMSALGEIDPEKDLANDAPVDEASAVGPSAADWTEREMDILELHGYYRVRPEMYHRFNVRSDDAVYNRTMAQQFRSRSYKNGTLAGANMRFRLDPTLNVSEHIRVKSQIDFLDNVMLGSTPRFWQGYTDPDGATLQVGRAQGWDMGPPSSSDMMVVRRAWAEVMTPLGQLRFGRMGDHFGTGMLHNAGNGIQNDFGDTVDRLMFAAKVNNWLIAPAFDFPNEGMSASDASGRPFDVSQLDDAYRLVGIFAYQHDEEEQAAMLKRGDWLINTGLYFSYRWQVLSFENSEQSSGDYDVENDSTLAATDATTGDSDAADYYSFYTRELWTITPDLWFQLLYDTFHFELEAALVVGKLGNPSNTETDDLTNLRLLQWGGVLQIDYGLLSDALRIGLEFGYAHGDKDVESLRAPDNYDQRNDNDLFSAFSFNPAYNTDLILHHHILGSVSQSLYLKAFLNYDFLKSEMGRKLSIRADVLYSRAIFSETVIGSSANLGVELNAQVRYQSEDGFYAGLAYGVLFPLGAFKGDPDGPDSDRYRNSNDLTVPQTIQTLLGVVF